ncbi:DUF547 domain-containing protein [Roseivirga misakiensis]|uniref:DUF547 domain-containing protein n=1 Tax=Roseivirga misakiensis TaxID=1563681 RepID=A0A1E5T1A5_9BACT|nr:DUF547 domain-containing protein [Roseivirga misakiensis]OEK05149.1 hypothetical protein BFP71_17205 [Roseivirga misakiensis]
MSFDHAAFSRSSKVILNDYLASESYAIELLEKSLRTLEFFALDSLKNDAQKLAFWINVYNGFTNYQIVKNSLSKSVFEKTDFFTDRALKIGELDLSLDDIEHGILRRNGERKNGKPKQFLADDLRHELMVDEMDYRVHFALNCGSISCPPIAYYSAAKIDAELGLAEQNFSASEFEINDEKKEVICSSIFIWYRKDFGNRYLNDPNLSQYKIIERPYIWKIQ